MNDSAIIGEERRGTGDGARGSIARGTILERIALGSEVGSGLYPSQSDRVSQVNLVVTGK